MAGDPAHGEYFRSLNAIRMMNLQFAFFNVDVDGRVGRISGNWNGITPRMRKLQEYGYNRAGICSLLSSGRMGAF